MIDSAGHGSGCIPFGLVLHVHLSLGVVADVANLRKTPDVELCSTELRHDGVASSQWRRLQNVHEATTRFTIAAGGEVGKTQRLDWLPLNLQSSTPQPPFCLPRLHKHVKSQLPLAKIFGLSTHRPGTHVTVPKQNCPRKTRHTKPRSQPG